MKKTIRAYYISGRESSLISLVAFLMSGAIFLWALLFVSSLLNSPPRFMHSPHLFLMLFSFALWVIGIVGLPIFGFLIINVLGGYLITYIQRYYRLQKSPPSVFYVGWIFLEIMLTVCFAAFILSSKNTLSASVNTSLVIIGVFAYIFIYLTRQKLSWWAIIPIVQQHNLTTLIGETVYISKQLQSLIEAVQLYITTIVSNKSQRLMVLMILLFTVATFITVGVMNSIDSLLDSTLESRICIMIFALFLILAVYLLGVFWFSQLQKIYFFSTRQIRNRQATRLLRELCTLEESAQKIASLSWEKSHIGEYITSLEWLADQVVSIQKFHGVLLQIIQPSWIERRYSVFPDASLLTQAFQVWALSLQESVGISLKNNLALMRAEIRVQQVRVQKLSAKSVEFAGVTELQAKRLADLEKRLVI